MRLLAAPARGLAIDLTLLDQRLHDLLGLPRCKGEETVELAVTALVALEPPDENIVLVLGRVAGRASADDITVFKSLGMAVEDVVAADLVFRRASESGAGTELTL